MTIIAVLVWLSLVIFLLRVFTLGARLRRRGDAMVRDRSQR